MEKPTELPDALETAIKAYVPFVLDVRVNRDIKPPGIGAWELPPIPYGEPVFGKRRVVR